MSGGDGKIDPALDDPGPVDADDGAGPGGSDQEQRRDDLARQRCKLEENDRPGGPRLR
jgi:hypothetical protein